MPYMSQVMPQANTPKKPRQMILHMLRTHRCMLQAPTLVAIIDYMWHALCSQLGHKTPSGVSHALAWMCVLMSVAAITKFLLQTLWTLDECDRAGWPGLRV